MNSFFKLCRDEEKNLNYYDCAHISFSCPFLIASTRPNPSSYYTKQIRKIILYLLIGRLSPLLTSPPLRSNRQPPLHIHSLNLSADMASWQHVKTILILVELAVLEPEANATNERKNSHRTVVPDEQRVLRQRDKGLAERSRKGSHEQSKSGNERTHVLWRLGETILERGDGGEDLRDGDQDVSTSLRPDVDRSWLFALGSLAAARRLLVDVSLYDRSPDHGHGAEEETDGDLLDRSESDAGLAESRVEEEVANGNEDDEREGIEVLEDIVGQAVELHRSSLRDQVVVELVVCEPVEREPEEHGAGGPTTSNLVDPCIVKGLHPRGLGALDLAGLQVLPECTIVHVAVGSNGIQVPAALCAGPEQLNSGAKYVACRGSAVVHLAASNHDERCETVHGGREQEG